MSGSRAHGATLEGEPGQPGLDPALPLDQVAALVAGVHVRPGALLLGRGELAVEQRADAVAQVADHVRPLTAPAADAGDRARSSGPDRRRGRGGRARAAAGRGRGGSASGRCRAWRRGSRRSPRRTAPRRRRARPRRGSPGGSVASARSTSSSNRWSAYAASGLGERAGEPVGALVGQRVEADPLLAAGLVEEEVGGDPVQPALEGARGVGRQRAEDPDEDLLGEVLGVVAVAGQPVGEPVDPVGVLVDDLVPGRHGARVVARRSSVAHPSIGGSVSSGRAA